MQQETGPGPPWALTGSHGRMSFAVLWGDSGKLIFVGAGDSELRRLEKVRGLELLLWIQVIEVGPDPGSFGLRQ